MSFALYVLGLAVLLAGVAWGLITLGLAATYVAIICLVVALGVLALFVARPISRALRRQEQQRRAIALASTLGK